MGTRKNTSDLIIKDVQSYIDQEKSDIILCARDELTFNALNIANKDGLIVLKAFRCKRKDSATIINHFKKQGIGISKYDGFVNQANILVLTNKK